MQNKQLYEEWFSRACDDGLNAQSILKHRDGSPSGVCFMAQQMAEKYLKGLLVFYKQHFGKVHDLLALETSLQEKVERVYMKIW